MAKSKAQLNEEVSQFLDGMEHPMRKEIDVLRHEILNANPSLSENIKWNGPNYSIGPEDRITMRVQPPKQVQLIFHRGAKVKAQPPGRLIDDTSGLLAWKANDRAVATFKAMKDIETGKPALAGIVREWLNAAAE